MTAARLATTLTLAATLVAVGVPRSGAAQADPTARPIRFGIGGGVSLPVGDFKNGGDAAAIKRDFKEGVAGQGYVEFRAPGTPLGFRAAVSYNRCVLRFNTHSVGGISINDFICAAKVNALVACVA